MILLSLQILLIDSAQYDTVRNLTPRSLILGEDSEKFEYLGENESKNENILTHWSVAQADSNDEKTGGRKSLWNILLTRFLLPKKRRWYNGEHSCLPSNTCAISIPDLFVIAQALGLLSKCRFLPTLTKHLVNFLKPPGSSWWAPKRPTIVLFRPVCHVVGLV